MWKWLKHLLDPHTNRDCDCGKNNYVPLWSGKWSKNEFGFMAYCKSCYSHTSFGVGLAEAEKNLRRMRKQL